MEYSYHNHESSTQCSTKLTELTREVCICRHLIHLEEEFQMPRCLMVCLLTIDYMIHILMDHKEHTYWMWSIHVIKKLYKLNLFSVVNKHTTVYKLKLVDLIDIYEYTSNVWDRFIHWNDQWFSLSEIFGS